MASIHELVERKLRDAAEAIIFAADAPVRAVDVANAYAEVSGEERPADEQIERAVERLNREYEETGRSVRIERWAGGYRMATVRAVAPYLKAFFGRSQEERLSRSLMETLAIVAYRQPVTKPEIDFVRGVDAGYAVSKLLEKSLIDVVGRSDGVGRPLLYGTTPTFLEQFGLTTVNDLPDLREIEEILAEPAFSRERAQLLHLDREDSVGGQPPSDEGPPAESAD